MLNKLRRRKTAKRIWIIIAIVVLPAFCLWGFGGFLRSRKESGFVKGEIFGKQVSQQEYLENQRAVRNQYLIQLGEENLNKLEKYLPLEAQTWERIILLLKARRQRIKVSDKEVVDFIQQYPFFQKNGAFNHQLYQETVTYVFRSLPRTFEEETRNNLILAKFYQEVSKDVTVGDEEIRFAYIKENEKISLEYIGALADEFINEISVSEGELHNYYEKNSQQFKKPLSYNLEYIKLESIDKERINKITNLVNQKGLSLSQIGNLTGLEVKETGLFSPEQPIPEIGWLPEILEILPELESKGEIWPNPIKMDEQFCYFIKLKEKKLPFVPSFDEIEQEITLALKKEKAKMSARVKLEELKNRETLEIADIAKEFNLKTGSTELFRRKSYVEGLGDSDLFFAAVENLKENEDSEVIEAPSGFYIVKLKQRLIPDEEKFKQEKQDFADNLLIQKKQERFNLFLAELKNKANLLIYK